MLGGGPSGAAVARLLSAWGHAVRMITRPAGPARLAVSIPPSCRKLFDTIGVNHAIERAGFIRSTGNTVSWGDDAARVETFASGERGWQVDLQALSGLLIAEAQRAGASIEHRSIGEAEVGAWLESGAVVLDCTGRSGVVARAFGLRQYDDGPRTIALVGEWQHVGAWPVPDDSQTLVESYDAGWAWSVPVASSRVPAAKRHFAVMVDPQRSALARRSTARDIYLAEIARTRFFRDLTSGATLQDGPSGWDASTYHAQSYAGENWLLVGDTGSFIDPLSSAGVKKALASGWLAAIVVHTCLTRPAMRHHALAFFSQREQEIERHFSRASRLFLAEAAPTHPHAFWRDRAEPGEAVDFDETAAVRDAFRRLCGTTRTQFRLGPGVRIEPQPAVRDREIVLEPAIVTEAGSTRYVRDVDVAALLQLGPPFAQVPDLFEAYCRQHQTVALPDFLFALATAVARGWLVAE